MSLQFLAVVLLATTAAAAAPKPLCADLTNAKDCAHYAHCLRCVDTKTNSSVCVDAAETTSGTSVCFFRLSRSVSSTANPYPTQYYSVRTPSPHSRHAQMPKPKRRAPAPATGAKTSMLTLARVWTKLPPNTCPPLSLPVPRGYVWVGYAHHSPIHPPHRLQTQKKDSKPKKDALSKSAPYPGPPGPPGPTPGPSPCMATEKKECKKGCYWCESAFSPMGQCTDKAGAKYLPPTAYTCKKVKKATDDVVVMDDQVANADVDQAQCSMAHVGKDCVAKAGCQWCTSGSMGQCMSDTQAAYMPSSGIVFVKCVLSGNIFKT